MRGRDHQDGQLEEFVAARTQDLHHDAYQFTAAQQPAEELVIAVLAAMRRERVEMAQAGSTARLRMARLASRHEAPTEITDVSQLPAQFQVLARLSPRQRAVLALQVVDNYDERETSRALRMTTRAVTDTVRSIPYDELPGASPHSGELRSLLEDFGDLATAPSATTTLADIRAVPPPSRRPWWTYVAALLVVALTVGTLVFSQSRYNEWARSAEGLNHRHGTHFPAYTEGYKLVDIREVAPGPAETLDLGAPSALAIECAKGQADQSTMARLSGEVVGNFPGSCSAPGKRQQLMPAQGQTLIAIDAFDRKEWPVAIYRPLPWAQYPVATKDFTVEHDKTLTSLRPTDDHGGPLRPAVPGKTVTIRGSADHPNGTFTATLPTPVAEENSMPVFLGLLSPTSTGQFQLVVGSEAPLTRCGAPGPVFYATRTESKTCSLVDHEVPQVDYYTWANFQATGRSTTVRFTVTHARGPWTLQMVYDIYRTDNEGQLVSH